MEDTGGTYIGYRFVEKDGAAFVAQCIESDSGASESIVFQKLAENPVSADWSGLSGLWLRKDASYDEYQLFGLAAIHMGDTAPLDGYVDFGGSIYRVLDNDSAGAAAESVCGNGDLRRTDDGLLFSGNLYVPANSAAMLEDAGQIELESGTRWYRSVKELSINLIPVADTRILAYDAQGNLLFDSIDGTYKMALPENCYLMVCCS